MSLVRTCCMMLGILCVLPALAGAESGPEPRPEPLIVTAPAALRMVETGRAILIDVRSEREWRQTGLPRGGVAISIHDPSGRAGFLAKVRARIGPPGATAILTICATGVRSDRAGRWLLQAGYNPVMTIREGMLGRWHPFEPSQPGWLKRHLPTTSWPPPGGMAVPAD